VFGFDVLSLDNAFGGKSSNKLQNYVKKLQKVAKSCKTYTKCCQTFEKVAQKDAHRSQRSEGSSEIS
jgi:hypothetical protein